VTSSGEVGLDMQPLLDVQSLPGELADDGRDDEASDGAAEDKLRPGEELSGIYSVGGGAGGDLGGEAL
jgi:hypothetical protein